MHPYTRPIHTFAMVLMGLAAVAQAPTDSSSTEQPSRVYDLGVVTIVGSSIRDTLTTITPRDIELYNRLNVADAVNLLPGVTLAASGSRNETMVNVRGFDLRQVPVFLDGIPIYVPYDGYVDLARFATMDLSRIDVSKGFTSILYGPNTMGGAINMVTRRPVGKLHYNGSLALINTNGGAGNLNLGGWHGKFFAQGGIAYLQRGDYSLSKDFVPTKHENGGLRDGSGFTDQRINVKAGYAPNANTEYVLGYLQQHGEKGVPIYGGIDERNPLLKKPRFWEWPTWDKQNVYFMSRNRFRGSKDELNAKVYLDRFQNALNSYDDSTMSTMTKPYAIESRYNDQAYGGSVEYVAQAVKNNLTKVAATYRYDEHQEHNVGDPVQTFRDRTYSIGLENILYLREKWQVTPGISYSARRNIQADNIDPATERIVPFGSAPANEAVNAQLLLQYKLHPMHFLRLAGSRKSRFATVKDRYSYRMGAAVPNPGLASEFSYNTEFSYTGTFGSKLQVDAALFHNSLDDVIQQVDNAVGSKWQMQNTGRAEFLGGEIAVAYAPHAKVRVGANYSYIQRKNLDRPEIHFTDVPTNKVFAFVDVRPSRLLYLNANTEYDDFRYSTSYGTRTDPYTLINAKVGFNMGQRFSLEGSVNNIIDTNYAIVEGYPCEGRNYMVRLLFRSIDPSERKNASNP